MLVFSVDTFYIFNTAVLYSLILSFVADVVMALDFCDACLHNPWLCEFRATN